MLSLKIDNQFIALPDSTEISIEASNPIFSDAGAKTYLFEVPVESLRYIIGNADEIYGESLYDVLEGKRAEIYIDGVQFFSGVVNLEDEISIEDGKMAVSIASGNLEFAQMIEGMNCRDVELKDEIEIGTTIDKIQFKVRPLDSSYEGDRGSHRDFDFDLPDEYILFTKDKPANISIAYPNSPYCNIRVCSTLNSDSDFKTLLSEKYQKILGVTADSSNTYEVFEASRRSSGLCFYVLYFLDSLFKKLKVSHKDGISYMEDIKRLAMVNLACDVKRENWTNGYYNEDIDLGVGGDFFMVGNPYRDYYSVQAVYSFSKAYATSNNFPDVEVDKIINSLECAFGVKFLYNSENGEMETFFIKDLLLDTTVKEISTEVYETIKSESNNPKGFMLSYNGDKEDSSCSYYDYSDVKPMDKYGEVIGAINANQKTCFVDTRNGNAYRVLSHGEAEDEQEQDLRPSLFEVGAFNDARFGDCSNENYVERIDIPFTPIINNDVGYANSSAKSNSSKRRGESVSDDSIENVYALFIDEEIEKPKTVKVSSAFQLTIPGTRDWLPETNLHYSYISYQGEDFSNSTTETSQSANPGRVGSGGGRKYISLTGKNKINSYDTGLMLGIMRGPGSDSEPETFAQDFDGEGNYRVAFTAANYAFTSDSIDNCNRDFDYNGTATGVGPDELKGRFSLKLRAGKYDKDGNLIPALQDADGNSILSRERAERGLYDTFWKEYAYFTVNKKILRMTCGMEIADIINLDWTKRYKIGEWTGFIANYSFNVNKDGMSEVELEMYYI